MRYRFVFITGLGIGFVLGARAGRERYEQIRKLARKAWESPSVQQAAGAFQAQAADFAKTTKDKVTGRVPAFADAARSRAGEAVHRIPGRGKAGDRQAGSDGLGSYTSAPGNQEDPHRRGAGPR